MRSPKFLDLLVLGLSVLTVAEATAVDANARLAFRNGVAIQRRQTGTGTGGDSTSSSSTTTPPPSSTPTPSNTPTPTPTPSPSRSSSSTSSSASQSATTTPAPSTTPPSTTGSSTESVETITSTFVITTTGVDGQPSTLTTQSTVTQTPGLTPNGSSAQTGMTPQTRSTVIGVVVGVGGAIILGGLAFVAWRIWGRKKPVEDQDDLMDYPSTAGGEKPDTANSMSGRTPFQSTLESYHTPKQVNTASNF